MLSLSNLKAPTPAKAMPERRANALAKLEQMLGGPDVVTITLEKLASQNAAKLSMYMKML